MKLESPLSETNSLVPREKTPRSKWLGPSSWAEAKRS
jgi:hypothetical protein